MAVGVVVKPARLDKAQCMSVATTFNCALPVGQEGVNTVARRT